MKRGIETEHGMEWDGMEWVNEVDQESAKKLKNQCAYHILIYSFYYLFIYLFILFIYLFIYLLKKIGALSILRKRSTFKGVFRTLPNIYDEACLRK